MGKDKLRKFAELDTFSNAYQLEEGKPLKGQWCSRHFKNNNNLVLELACGKGEYAVGMGKLYPNKNFIGIDIKGNRMWRGAKTALEESINNVAFLRMQIEDLPEYFGPDEVDEIWITFPDPQPQLSREKKRLTAPGFLRRYKEVLKPGANINLKTDNDGLYTYTMDVIKALGLTLHENTADLYHSNILSPALELKTHYERMYLKHDKNINYVRFSLPETYTGVK